ncbi:bifunctional alpha/beta hydrolase/OsmC family protein [Microbaculum marinum]|uniref:Bifunctional alpha/beta hydrolase/OsmC family protein n=1 Tax=Microbaculum marinum TaxID=1764581 RepID=A0AAW9S0E6_9HYPH
MAIGQRVTFTGSLGDELSARLDLPAGEIHAFALVAHCFSCSKEQLATSHISTELAKRGIAVLRFDFTGLGSSKGEFANTDFSSNVQDLVKAADWLRETYEAPRVLIGHSLGGAAVLAAASAVPEAVAVVTIGAPASTEHVIKSFAAEVAAIEEKGEATVSLAGREFRIRKHFLDDVRSQDLLDKVAHIRKALLVLHSPTDDTVGIENARLIYDAAKHPKGFISLDGADHLLTRRRDAAFAAEIISAWVARYLDIAPAAEAVSHDEGVTVMESGEGAFQQFVRVGPHRLLADEPVDKGGTDSGPTPYDFLSIGLAACTSMTLRMYAERKKLDLGRVRVTVTHGKIHADDCADCADGFVGRIDRFERHISVEGDYDEATQAKILEIADKCPVHRTLDGRSAIVTKLDG